MLTTEATDAEIRQEAARIYRGLPPGGGTSRVWLVLYEPASEEPDFSSNTAGLALEARFHRVSVEVIHRAMPTWRGIKRWVEMGEVRR